METLEENFSDIAGELADVEAAGDQILEEQQIPFGAELLTETPDHELHLGALACVHNKGTQVDDAIITGTTGADSD